MHKTLFTTLCLVVLLHSQDKPHKDSSIGKTVFISTVALESVALTGYLATTCISLGNKKNTVDQEALVITSFPFRGTYFLSSGIEKFVSLHQNVKLKKEGKERYRAQSAFQVALYTTSFLTGVATVFTFCAAWEYGEYGATKALMATNSCLMIGQFIYDIHLYKKNNLLLKNDIIKSSNLYQIKPYFGLTYKRDLQLGVQLYF